LEIRILVDMQTIIPRYKLKAGDLPKDDERHKYQEACCYAGYPCDRNTVRDI
jgi:hypothetical protein